MSEVCKKNSGPIINGKHETGEEMEREEKLVNGHAVSNGNAVNGMA